MNTQSIVQLVQRLVFCPGTAVMQNIQNNTGIALSDTGWNTSCPGTAVEFGVTWSPSFSICWNDTWKWRRSFNKVTFLIICNLSCEGKSYNAGKTCKKDSDLSVFILCTNSEKCAEIETFQPFKWAGQWLFESVFNVRSHPWRAFLTLDSMQRLPYYFLPFRPGWTFLCAENAQQCIFHKDKKNALHCALFSLRKVRHGLNCLCTFELCTCARCFWTVLSRINQKHFKSRLQSKSLFSHWVIPSLLNYCLS